MNKVNHSLGAIIIIFLSLFQKLAVGLVGLVVRGGKESLFRADPLCLGGNGGKQSAEKLCCVNYSRTYYHTLQAFLCFPHVHLMPRIICIFQLFFFFCHFMVFK